MRVTGNCNPDVVTILPYPPVEGFVEVRLRENVADITEAPEEPLFEYDEYILVVPEKEGLLADIEADLVGWMLTGRTLEENRQASSFRDAVDALALLGVTE